MNINFLKIKFDEIWVRLSSLVLVFIVFVFYILEFFVVMVDGSSEYEGWVEIY